VDLIVNLFTQATLNIIIWTNNWTGLKCPMDVRIGYCIGTDSQTIGIGDNSCADTNMLFSLFSTT